MDWDCLREQYLLCCKTLCTESVLKKDIITALIWLGVISGTVVLALSIKSCSCAFQISTFKIYQVGASELEELCQGVQQTDQGEGDKYSSLSPLESGVRHWETDR